MVRMITTTAQIKFGPSLCLCVIIILTACVYLNSLHCPFIWDDQDLVIDNFLIKDYKFIPQIFTADIAYGCGKQSKFYRPVQITSYMFDYSIGRLNPLTYHIHNLILHILNSVLIFCILSMFFSHLIAFFTSLLFAIHPIHTEAVTYISGRADLLTSFFMLSSLFLYIVYRRKGLRRFYWYGLIAFLFALLSKELALIFPLIIFLLESFLLRKGDAAYNLRFKPIIGFLLVDILYLLWRYLILGGNSLFAYHTTYKFGARLLFFSKSIPLYIKNLMLPFNLRMSYDISLPRGIFDVWVWASLIFLLIILISLIYFYRKERIIFFGIMWFFIFLLPQANLFAINAFFADHFIYISSIGFFLIISYLFVKYSFKNKINEVD